MAKISLRSYNQEIENLINGGESEEAIAHCKYLLKLFPKHIDTYRLLGKAYLENQRYTEASDILKRVLSVIPDDFISQIGLSIIREDEGNLDAAIWHMERAFEVQPSNAAIQEELRRLYGKRDGLQPHRVRLTRGALVRMYAKGELYPQAIAEARAALAEDPQRTDLMIILARCYYSSGQEVEATEVCSRLISKLPFCYEANRILAEILPKTSKAEDAKTYQQRVSALDPYYSLISPNAPTSEQVADNAVTVERLIWQSSSDATSQPDWARSVGVEIKEHESETPDWMNAIPTGENITSIESQEEESQEVGIQEAESQEVESPTDLNETLFTNQEEMELESESLVPDWMKDAGWTKSNEESPPDQESIEFDSFSESDNFEEVDEISPNEVPDWIKSLAPQEEMENPDEEEKLDILNQILPPQVNVDKETDSILKDTDSHLDEEQIRDSWDSEDFAIDSLKEEPISFEEKPEQSIQDTQESEDIPDWLKDFSEKEPEQKTNDFKLEENEELPDWLKTLSDEDEDKNEDIKPIDLSQSERNTDLGAFPIEEIEEDETPVSLNDQEWLENLAQEHSAAQETLDSPAGESLEEPPSWIFEAELQDEQPAEEPEDSTIDAEPQVKADNSLDWLNELEPAEPEAASAFQALDDREEIEETPDSSMEQVDLESAQQEELDEGFAWLESLAAKQGADEETLILKPENRMEETPDWLKEFKESEADQEIPSELSDDDSEDASAFPQTLEKEDRWISEFESSAETKQITPDEDHLQQIQTDTPLAESILPKDREGTTKEDSDFSWLDSSADQADQEEDFLETIDLTPETSVEWGLEESSLNETLREEITPSEDLFPAQDTEPLENEESPESLEVSPSEDFLSDFQEKSQLQDIQSDALEQLETETESSDWDKEPSPVDEEKTADIPFVASQFIQEEEVIDQAEPQEQKSETPDFDSDDVFSWLESLARKQGADEETLITKPEERTDAPPEWLAKASIESEEIESVSPEAESLESKTSESEVSELSGVIKFDSAMEDTQETVTHPQEDHNAFQQQEVQTRQDEEVAEIDLNLLPQEEEAMDEKTEESIPDWLEGLESEITPSQDTDTITALPEEEAPAEEVLTEETLGEFSSPPEENLSQSIEEPAGVSLEAYENPEPEETAVEHLPDIAAPDLSSEEVAQFDAGTTENDIPFLTEANKALSNQDVDSALVAYNEAIQQGDFLDQIIEDLNQAVYRFPLESALWMALGDAFSQKGQIQNALDAYSKGEELLQ